MADKPITKEKKSPKGSEVTGRRLLPLTMAAEQIGITLWSLRERIWHGDIAIVRFPKGRKMFVDTKDIEQFIEKNKFVIK